MVKSVLSLFLFFLLSTPSWASLTAAFFACVGDGSRLHKTSVHQSDESIISIHCHDDLAARLFEAVKDFSTLGRSTGPGKRLAITRYFGLNSQAPTVSQCVRKVTNSDGSDADGFSCYINLDLNREVTQAISLKTGEDSLSTSFRECIRPQGQPWRIRKIGIDGTGRSVLGIPCSGSSAKDLYEAVRPYSKDSTETWESGRLVKSRYFGDLNNGPSGCYRQVTTPDGETVSKYWCNIIIDVTPNLIKGLD